MGFIIRKLYISVNRKSKEDRLRSKQRMMASIKEGISVFICPEGTRNTSQATLLEFKDGAFQLAIDAQVPIAVLTIHGSSKLLSPIGFLFHPGKIKAIWAGTIDTKGMNSNDLPRLKAQAREMMLKDLLHSDRL